MNEQLTAKVLEYLSNTEAFLSAQVPDFIHQYLLWNFYSSIFFIVFSLLVAVASWAIWAHLNRQVIKNKADNRPDFDPYGDPQTNLGWFWVVTLICSILASLFAFISTCTNIPELIKITVSPKVFLVDSLTATIKK